MGPVVRVGVGAWTGLAAPVGWLSVGLLACGAPSGSAAAAQEPRAASVVETVAGPIEAGSGGLDTDADGTVYMGDFGAHLSAGPIGRRVWRITPAGDVDVFAEGLAGASGNAFDEEGYLLQANIGGNSISRIAPDGAVEPFASEGFRNPVGVAVSGDGTVYATNCGANTVVRVVPGGAAEVVSDSPLLQCPNGLVVGPDGELYVSNFRNGDVLRVEPGGATERVATIPGDNNGHLLYGNGVLYVAGRTANRIYELTLDGELRAIAGSGERGIDDGPALEATMSLPNDLALSPDGRWLYWNDVAPDHPDPRVLTPTYIRRLRLQTAGSPGPRRSP